MSHISNVKAALRSLRNVKKGLQSVVSHVRNLFDDLVYTFSRATLVIVALIGVLALISAVFVGTLFLPYSPMKIYSYEAVPREVCPSGIVKTRIDYSINARHAIINGVSRSQWVAVDATGYTRGQILEGEALPLPKEQFQPGRFEIKGKLLRRAPPAPGEWRFGANLELHGPRFTQVQVLTPEEETTTTVLPADNKACEGTA